MLIDNRAADAFLCAGLEVVCWGTYTRCYVDAFFVWVDVIENETMSLIARGLKGYL